MAKAKGMPRAVIFIIIIIIVSFLYVWQRIQIIRIGYQIREFEKELIKTKEDNAVLQLEISRLTSPREIRQKVAELGLDLVPPKEKQIVRVK